MSHERRDPPNVDGMFTLKVDNISFHTTPEMLKDEFAKYGEVGDVYIPRNFSNNESRGFAFVRFLEERDGRDAMAALEGKDIDGRSIRIQEARQRRADRPREEMSRRGYSDRDRYGDRGRDRYEDRGRDRYDDRDRERDYRRGDDRRGRRSRDRGRSPDRRDRDGSGDRDRRRSRS